MLILSSDTLAFAYPAGDNLTIDGSIPNTGNISVVSASGKLMFTKEITEPGCQTIDLFGLPKGVYFVEVGKRRYRFVKI